MTKWVTVLEVTRFADKDDYWTRGWSTHGPVLVASRIDVPRAGATAPAKDGGKVVTAGTVWAQHTGVAEGNAQISDRPPPVPGSATGFHNR